jgi:hypothetical protein
MVRLCCDIRPDPPALLMALPFVRIAEDERGFSAFARCVMRSLQARVINLAAVTAGINSAGRRP